MAASSGQTLAEAVVRWDRRSSPLPRLLSSQPVSCPALRQVPRSATRTAHRASRGGRSEYLASTEAVSVGRRRAQTRCSAPEAEQQANDG